jgi:hypothetical protein
LAANWLSGHCTGEPIRTLCAFGHLGPSRRTATDSGSALNSGRTGPVCICYATALEVCAIREKVSYRGLTTPLGCQRPAGNMHAAMRDLTPLASMYGVTERTCST